MTKEKVKPSANGHQSPYQAILVDSGLALTDSGWIIEKPDPYAEPHFTVSEVAKVFFKRSPYWIRWNEERDFFMLDGEPVGNLRKFILPLTDEQTAAKAEGRRVKNGIEYVYTDSQDGARSYTLYDVERMAYALISRGAIDGLQLLGALRIVQTIAELYEIIGAEVVVELPSPKDVPCPRCEAVAGERCKRLTPGKHAYVDSFHKARHEAFEEEFALEEVGS